MRDYWIYEHDEEVWRENFGKGFWNFFDGLAPIFDILTPLIGEAQLLTDSRSRKAKNQGRVRFVLPRSAVYTHGVNRYDVRKMLEGVGVRTRKYTYDSKNVYFTVRGTQSKQAIAAIEAWKAGKPWEPWVKKARRQKAEKQAAKNAAIDANNPWGWLKAVWNDTGWEEDEE